MTDNGRLIINARGETAQVLRQDGKRAGVVLQVAVHRDAVTALPGGLVCCELALADLEAAGLSLKLADQSRMICELRAKDAGRRG